MTELFKVNQIVKVVPEDVEQACSMEIVETDDGELKLSGAREVNINSGIAEFFAVVEGGIIYFESTIEDLGNNQYKVILPPTNKILQRREYSRVKFNSTVVLKNAISEFTVETTDLSAGGMQIISQNELVMSDDYDFSLEFDKNKFVKSKFTPIRQDKTAEGEYVVSGKFKDLDSKSRILLVQFCFKKQMENTNK